VRRRPLIGRQFWIADEIRTLRAEARERVEVGRLGHGDWNAGLHRGDQRDGPVVRDRADHAVALACVARAIGDEPHRGRDEHIRDVARRVVAFEVAVEAVGHWKIRDRARQDPSPQQEWRRRCALGPQINRGAQ